MKKTKDITKKGFTLIELLITISIMTLLSTIAYVSLNPGKRNAEARNSQRWADVNIIMNAIVRYSVDNNGDMSGLRINSTSLTNNKYYVLGTATADCDLDCHNSIVTTPYTDLDDDCFDITNSNTNDIDDYLNSLPVDPLGTNSSIEVTTFGTVIDWDNTRSGYWIKRTAASGRIDIGACEPEDPDGGGSPDDIIVSIF